MLLFRSEETVTLWCAARSLPKRPRVRLDQLWSLAIAWYANRLTVEARRPAPREMARIFGDLGLNGSFWDPLSDDWQRER